MASQPKRQKLTAAERQGRRAFPRHFVVHPNRSALGPDEPGRNGHFRVVRPSAPPRRLTRAACTARVRFPQPWHGYGAAADGSMVLTASKWHSVVAGARSIAVDYGAGEVLPPFGFTDRSRGRGWFWWDGTRTEHSILEAEDAQSHVRRYLEDLFPTALSIELEERR
jgi:hypothetical protein